MKYKNILITGGAGFVGSNLAIKLKNKYPRVEISVLDNLKRRGSELNLNRLKNNCINFIHGDVRNIEDLDLKEKVDLIIECSAEPSVLANIDSIRYSLNTNLIGTLNCLELARRKSANFIFLSTSRVYPVQELNQIKIKEGPTRFEISPKQKLKGISQKGVSEEFTTGEFRSLYGTSKLCSEMLIKEYCHNFSIKAVINRCGIITGPWQMGKVDQGIIVLWMARHFWKNNQLSYIGFGGQGKQVRDFIDIDDLFDVIDIQLNDFNLYQQNTFNIGGGKKNSLSLKEMTKICQEITGNKINIKSDLKNRIDDVPLYISDTSKFQKISGWSCKNTPKTTFKKIYQWLLENQDQLKDLLN